MRISVLLFLLTASASAQITGERRYKKGERGGHVAGRIVRT